MVRPQTEAVAIDKSYIVLQSQCTGTVGEPHGWLRLPGGQRLGLRYHRRHAIDRASSSDRAATTTEADRELRAYLMPERFCPSPPSRASRARLRERRASWSMS